MRRTPITSDEIRYGRNFDKGPYRDSSFLRCDKCGFVANTDRDVNANPGDRMGYGIKNEFTLVNDASVTVNQLLMPVNGITDPDVVSGCPLCGSYLYKGGA
jgi:hypothetical protein